MDDRISRTVVGMKDAPPEVPAPVSIVEFGTEPAGSTEKI